MAKLGKYIKQSDARNSDGIYTLDNLKGISIQKCFIESKADMKDVSLTPYLLVPHNYFAYVTVTSRNGEKITLAHNTTNNTYIVSSSYVVFYVSDTDSLLPDYLFMYFNRPEFDRYTRFNSWGSARETFSWDDLCDIDIELPTIEIQKKVATVYNAMKANQEAYEKGLDDLKLTCDAHIEDLRKKMPTTEIGGYIESVNISNTDYSVKNVMGVSADSLFIETKAKMDGIDTAKYTIVSNNDFAYNPSRINIGSIALFKGTKCAVSPMYVVFRIKDQNILFAEYLMMWLSRKEFHRYTWFYAAGSVRDTFDYSLMCEVKIPIPDIKIQQSIVDIYNAYIIRREINERLKAQIKDICPILIKGSLQAV